MKKLLMIELVLLTMSYNSLAQSIVIGTGASIYVPVSADVCAESYGNITGNIYGEGKQCGQTPLPVELSSFTALVEKKFVRLSWQTETEVNNYGFEIERKNPPLNPLQGGDFESIGFVEGYGNSNSPKKYSFIDKNPVGGSVFQYRLKQIDNDGTFEYSDVVEVELIPNEFVLYQNYPNPFNPATTIKYALPFESKVRIVLYNSLGEFVKELIDEVQTAGYQEVIWNANNFASGVYIYTIKAVPTNKEQTYTSIKKMILLK